MADTASYPVSKVEAEPIPDSHRSLSSMISRNELFAGLALIGFANGISDRVISSTAVNGITVALLNTFNISVIVWSACAISISFLLRDPVQPLRPLDWIVATCALAAFLVPVAPLSWLALAGLAVYILCGSLRSSFHNRGAWILLAITVPMFWARLLFTMLSDLILQGDAILVGWLVGTHHLGNTVQLADGSGYLWIAPGCSSLANISLAILCWVTVSRTWGRPGSLRDIEWVAIAGSSVMAINVARISLIGLYPESYDLLHGPVGTTIASWVILGVTVGICLLGIRHDLAARA